jgi:hypothetical protein
MAFLDSLITMSIMGRITGKLKMAIKEVLFSALAAIPEIIVKLDANPSEPSTIEMRK